MTVAVHQTALVWVFPMVLVVHLVRQSQPNSLSDQPQAMGQIHQNRPPLKANPVELANPMRRPVEPLPRLSGHRLWFPCQPAQMRCRPRAVARFLKRDRPRQDCLIAL